MAVRTSSTQWPSWYGPPPLNFEQGIASQIDLLQSINNPKNVGLQFSFPPGSSYAFPNSVAFSGPNNRYVNFDGSTTESVPHTGMVIRIRATTTSGKPYFVNSPETRVTIAATKVKPTMPPINVSATPLSQTTNHIAWSPDPNGATPLSYKVWRSADGVTFTNNIGNPTAPTTSFDDVNAGSGVKRYYCVETVSATGTSMKSLVVSATAFAGPPAEPVGEAASGTSATSIRVSWVPGTGSPASPAASTFNVYHSTDPNGPFDTPLTTGVTDSVYDHTGLLPETDHYYQVTGVDANGVESSKGPTVKGTTQAVPKPQAPTGVTVAPSSDTAVSVAWTASAVAPVATSFRIERALDVNGSPGAWTSAGTDTATPFADSGLVAGTKYWYRVIAIVAGQESTPSVAASGMTYVTTPSRPENVIASTIDQDSIRVTWTAPVDTGTPPNTYTVWHATTDTTPANYTQIATGIALLTYIHTGLDPDTDHYYRVSATDAEGQQGQKSGNPPGYAHTLALPTPVKPEQVAAKALDTDSIQVTWENGVGGSLPTSYRVYRSTTPGVAGSTGTLVDSPTSMFSVQDGLQPNTTYYFRVSSHDGTTEGPKSLEVSAKTDAVVTPPVTEATFIVKPSTSSRTFNGANASGWVFANGAAASRAPRAGDIIEIQVGTHGALTFTNLTGDASNRITIRGPQTGSAQAVVKSGSSFLLSLQKLRDVTIDGYLAGAPKGCGLKVSANAGVQPTAFIKFKQMPKRVKLAYIEIAGNGVLTSSGSSTAIQLNDGNDNRCKDYVGQWVEDIEYDHIWAHEAGGFYTGSNYEANEEGGLEVPIRRISIHHCRIENTGQECIGLKKAWQGPNVVAYNIFKSSGQQTQGNPPQRNLMSVQCAAAIIHDNLFLDAGSGSTAASQLDPNALSVRPRHGPDRILGVPIAESGVANPAGWNKEAWGVYPVLEVEIYNNLFDQGVDKGILVGRDPTGNSPQGAGCVNGPPHVRLKCYNNTVCHYANDDGIDVDASDTLYQSGTGSFVRNNIVRGNATNLSGWASAYDSVNDVGTIGANGANFVNPNASPYTARDFHLAVAKAVAGSSALGTDVANKALGGSGTVGNATPDDLDDGATRTLGSADKGCYEYT